MFARRLAALLFLLLTGWGSASAALAPIPRLTARVTDQTGTLTPDQKQALELRLQQVESTKGSQVAVLIVPTTEPEAIEQYSIRVVEAWKLGRKKVDDGVLLIVAKNDRTLRIEVGYGLEGALPDAIAKRIIEETIVPQFRAGDFAAGISAGVEQIIRVIDGEPLPPPPARHTSGGSAMDGSRIDQFGFWIMGAFVASSLLRAIMGRFMGGVVGGLAGGVVAYLMFHALLVSGVVALLIFIVTLLGNTGGRGSGTYYGGSSRSSGGGGFSGGGGGFGGGGASGRW